jgi:hypothetical protein
MLADCAPLTSPDTIPSRHESPTDRFLSLFAFITLRIPISATPLYSHPYKTPGVSPTVAHPRFSQTLRTLCLGVKLRIFILLRTLYLSCSSFSDSRPLFSIVCALFCKNTPGVWVSRPPAGHPRALCGFARHNFGLEDFRLSGFRPEYPGATGYTDGTE